LSAFASFKADIWGGVVGEAIAGGGGVVLNLNLEGGASAEYFAEFKAQVGGYGIKNKTFQGVLEDKKFKFTLGTATIHFPN
jgi:hypothetical protein